MFKRTPKQDDKLKLYWLENEGIAGIVPIGKENRCDLYYLFKEFCMPITGGISKELENRGYDLTTIYFEIKKKDIQIEVNDVKN